MPSQRTGGGYCKWGVVDTYQDNEFMGGELTMEDAITAASKMNENRLENRGLSRYAPAKHIGFGNYRRLQSSK